MIRAHYQWHDFGNWDGEIHTAIQDFRSQHGVVPNILLTIPATFKVLDILANREHVRNHEGRKPTDEEYAPLQAFVGRNYYLHFAVDASLHQTRFDLAHDPEAEFVDPSKAERSIFG